MQPLEKMLNLTSLEQAEVMHSPFPYIVIPHFIHPEYIEPVLQDFPKIQHAGSFPLSTVESGPVFEALIDELSSDGLRNIIAKQFQIDLSDKPVMITVRGKADRTDGRIHTDSKSKLITVLLYMNEDWQTNEGRLRLLYDSKNLENYAVEIPPTAGAALLFKVTENGWHGHKPIEGVRKVIQLNYVTNEKALEKHQKRHRLSAKFKKLFQYFGLGGY